MLSKTLVIILLFLMSVSALSAQSEIQMEEGAEQVHSLYKQLREVKDFRVPEGVSKRIGENYPAFQAALSDMYKVRQLRADNQEFLASFVKSNAGAETETYKIVRLLNAKFEPLALGYDVGDEYEYVTDRFSQLDSAGEQNAMTLLKLVQDNGLSASTLRALHEIYRVKSIEESKDLLTIAVLFDPGNERVERRVERLRGQIAENLKEYKEEEMRVLKSRSWKPNIGSTSAGDPPALAVAGKGFMTSQPDWGGNTKKQTRIVRVSIIGDWFVAERDALGRPTRYGLPAAVAVSDNTMDENVITVYEVSLITANPKKDTNFYGVWVGKVWRMLESNMPK